MYDLMFPDPGRATRGSILIALLNEAEVDVGRFRDAWVEPDEAGEPVIVIYTRNGGGNRVCEHLAPVERCPACAMRAIVRHPQHLRDEDDEFDSTYARIWFRLPEGLGEDGLTLLRAQMTPEPVDPDQRWQVAIEALDHEPLPPRLQAFGEQLVTWMNEAAMSDQGEPRGGSAR